MADLSRLTNKLLGFNREERFSTDDPTKLESLPRRIAVHMKPALQSQLPIVFVCIGTDRSTGDALGPLVGDYLAKILEHPFYVYGTLDQPVHASNLLDMVAEVNRRHPKRFIVAIDACLGRMENVGSITLGHGPLKPGAGVNKSLPAVGDCFITGTVNVGGFMEYFVLQNTRLSFVIRIANIISRSIEKAVISYDHSPMLTESLNAMEIAPTADPPIQ